MAINNSYRVNPIVKVQDRKDPKPLVDRKSTKKAKEGDDTFFKMITEAARK